MDSSKSIKTAVLKDEMSYLCDELGDPGRYFPSLRSKNLLDAGDCERIRGKPTSWEKTELMLDILLKREGHFNEHPLDILMSELKKQRVQVHIARRLQRTLKLRMKKSTNDVNGGFERQQSQSSASVDSLDDSPTNHPIVITPVTAGPKYEVNPAVGPIPNLPPPLTTHPSQPTHDIHPEHGVRPSEPPPPSHQMITQGVECMSLGEHNGHREMDSNELGGQSMGLSSMNTDSPVTSYQTGPSSYSTGVSSYPSDIDHIHDEKQTAIINDLQDQLASAQRDIQYMSGENAYLKQENEKLIQELSIYRSSQEPYRVPPDSYRVPREYRPGTLRMEPQHVTDSQHYLRQPSPGRSDTRSSQGETNSLQSANSNTSVNSLTNTQRTQMQSYV